MLKAALFFLLPICCLLIGHYVPERFSFYLVMAGLFLIFLPQPDCENKKIANSSEIWERCDYYMSRFLSIAGSAIVLIGAVAHWKFT